jgi:hypothetical protein
VSSPSNSATADDYNITNPEIASHSVWLGTDPFLERDLMIQRGGPSEELPEMTPEYVAFTTAAIFIFTIFTNVMFNLYIKPSVDGVEQAVRTQRVPLADPRFEQPGDSSS